MKKIKFWMYVKDFDMQDKDAWIEKIIMDNPEYLSMQDFAQQIIDKFNNSLRIGEKKRIVVKVMTFNKNV